MTRPLDNSWKWEIPQAEVMPVHAAIRQDAPEVLQQLKTFDLDLKDNYDNTPLHVAVEEDKPDWIEALIAAGASPSIINKQEETPLDLATRLGRKDCIEAFKVGEALSESWVLFESVAESPRYPIHEAIKKNSPNHTLLNQHVSSINDLDENGYAPLHIAVKTVNLQWVKWLVNVQANLKVRDLKGRTPLHHAAKKDVRKDILEHLISNGAELNAEDDERNIPLDLAHNYKAWNNAVILNGAAPAQVLALFPETDESGNTLLHSAILAMDEAIAPVGDSDWTALKNEKNSEGNTPLHLACLLGKMSWIQALISKNANINEKNIHGNTPLHIAAAIHDNQAVINLLIDTGAKSLKNNEQQDPASVALAAQAHSNIEPLRRLNS